MPSTQTQRVTYHVDDTGPPLAITVKDRSGTVVDLTGASITFAMENASTGTIKVAATAGSIVSASAGTAKYDFGASDLDTAGLYHGSFVITDANSDVITVPQRGYLEIDVQAKVS